MCAELLWVSLNFLEVCRFFLTFAVRCISLSLLNYYKVLWPSQCLLLSEVFRNSLCFLNFPEVLWNFLFDYLVLTLLTDLFWILLNFCEVRWMSSVLVKLLGARWISPEVCWAPEVYWNFLKFIEFFQSSMVFSELWCTSLKFDELLWSLINFPEIRFSSLELKELASLKITEFS